MNLSLLLQKTLAYEAFKPTPYKDTRGLWTFGTGRCLETAPLTANEWKNLLDSGQLSLSITPAGAQVLTQGRILAIDSELTTKWPPYSRAPDVVQNVLVEMAYQLGVAGLLTFSTFLGLVATQQYSLAAADVRAHTAWYRETTARAEALMRELEAV